MQNFAIAAFFLIAGYLGNQGALTVPGGKIFCSTGRHATGSNNDSFGYTITAPELLKLEAPLFQVSKTCSILFTNICAAFFRVCHCFLVLP